VRTGGQTGEKRFVLAVFWLSFFFQDAEGFTRESLIASPIKRPKYRSIFNLSKIANSFRPLYLKVKDLPVYASLEI
jgi:hypothetical protein